MEVIRGLLKLQRHSSKETAGHNTLLKIWWQKFATSHTCYRFEKVMGTRFIHCHLMPVITTTRTSLHVGEFVLSIWLSKIIFFTEHDNNRWVNRNENFHRYRGKCAMKEELGRLLWTILISWFLQEGSWWKPISLKKLIFHVYLEH